MHSVVDNLYSKEHRYVYELIQNADDNSYSVAAANNERPFLDFQVYANRIIIDSNEDGFSKSNIEAICSIGNSTKKNITGYIGEKGIGFKSVFKVASKVHIQSGPFSFRLSHTRDDDEDGLGMITPHHEDHEDLPNGVRTRMTLTLLDPNNLEKLTSEFQEVPDTFLMFLNRLERLSISLHPPTGSPTATLFSKREYDHNGLLTTILTKQITGGSIVGSTSEQRYYTMKSDLHSLPSDESRKDKEGRDIDYATAVLAFPIDENESPVLKQQYTYAFLPLRRVGFNFLIQSDFVTKADREDVVHSERNEAVLKGVAEAFVKAVVILCQRPSLRYQWMRYLPEESITDDFWKTLWPLVREKLMQTPLLESWSGQELYKPPDLRKLSEPFLDSGGHPLLPDIEGAEIYLSPNYAEGDFLILRRLGTELLSGSFFVDRLYADVRKSHSSRWKTLEENHEWRSRICETLSGYFNSGADHHQNLQKGLRSMSLIPLNDGVWASSVLQTKAYFPHTDEVLIPTDLNLKLVHPLAVENPDWKIFLTCLGVKSSLAEAVIRLISERYAAINCDNVSLTNAVAHMRYLFWFLPKDSPDSELRERLNRTRVRLANQHGSLLKLDQYAYSPSQEDDYSPSRLFAQVGEAPGLPVHYLHADYLKAVDPAVIHNDRSWMKWLEEIAGVRRIPEYTKEHSNVFGAPGSVFSVLSREFRYIIDHRSDRLLEVMKRGQTVYNFSLEAGPANDLVGSQVVIPNGSRTSLSNAFLPTPELQRLAAELGLAEAFPFIAMSEQLKDERKTEWSFLRKLRIGFEENLYFYLTALETWKNNKVVLSTDTAKDRLSKIYGSIQSRSLEDPDRVKCVYRRFVYLCN